LGRMTDKRKGNGCLPFIGIVVVGAIIVGVVGNRPHASAPVEPPRDESVPVDWPPNIAAMRVDQYLKDPKSATYQGVTFRKRHGIAVLCGQVNSRNSFGGHTGFQHFIVVGSLFQPEESTPTREWRKLWRGYCVDTDSSDSEKHAPHG
jgi:hypothetical protein